MPYKLERYDVGLVSDFGVDSSNAPHNTRVVRCIDIEYIKVLHSLLA